MSEPSPAIVAQPSLVIPAALRQLCTAAGADFGVFYRAGRGSERDEMRYFNIWTQGPERMAAVFASAEGMPAMLGVSIDQLVMVDEFEATWAEDLDTPFRAAIWDPFEIHSSLGLGITNAGGHFVGWFGAFRCGEQPKFSRRVPSAVRNLASTLSRAATTASFASTLALPDNGLLIFSADRKVESSNAAADEWLRVPTMRAELMRCVDANWSRGDGPPVSTTMGGVLSIRHTTGDTGERRIVTVDKLMQPLVPPIAKLSRVKRRVAALASAGATVDEIARHLERSPETVRSHVKFIYDQLGIGSRAELAVCVERAWDEKPLVVDQRAPDLRR
ncbi:MAG: helix-turn-helix transcriptional regulator [Myxococcales bacterium]|nr:helix-turn-helix transcriptional regulator [Myxococcales bacterium]